MSREIPTSEPPHARAGDTWEWSRSLSEFPATTWTLTYTYFNASAAFSIQAAADGIDHLIDVAPATTETYTAGRYDWIAHVSDGTDQYQVDRGSIDVLADLSAASSYDGRSHARKMLDYINAILEGSASDEAIHVVESNINARGIKYDIEALIRLKQIYAQAVQAEDNAEKLANGESTGRIIGVRFTA